MIYDPELLGQVHCEKFLTSDQLSLQSYCWDVPNPQAIVIAVHGVRSHIRFEWLSHNWRQPDSKQAPQRCIMYQGSWVEALNKDGIIVCGVDHRGHGQSESWNGSRCNTEFFDELANDILDYAISVHKKYNASRPIPLPIFLIGISMGGAVVLRVAQLLRYIQLNQSRPKVRCDAAFLDQLTGGSSIGSSTGLSPIEVRQFKNLPIRGYIAMCPAISVEALCKKWINRLLLPMSGPLAKLLPYARLAQVEQNKMFPWIEDDVALDADPTGFCNFNLPARIAHQTVLAGPRVFRDAALLHDSAIEEDCGEEAPCPVALLLIHSKLDTMVDWQGSQRLHDQLQPNMKDVKIWILDNMWHFLTQEPGNEELRERVCDWVKARLTPDTTTAKL